MKSNFHEQVEGSSMSQKPSMHLGNHKCYKTGETVTVSLNRLNEKYCKTAFTTTKYH